MDAKTKLAIAGCSAMKNSPIIAQLYCPFFNHIFYCHKKFPKKEDRPKALELVRSFLMHVQGKHRWKKGKKFQIITKCDHEKLKRRKKGDPPRPILKPSSKEYKLIEDMLYSRNFEKAFLDSSSLIDTALNESYHSLSPYIYNIKMKLSMMHHNSLILHEMQGLRKEILVEGVRVREQLDDTRVERRLGVPSDLVFDEICSWYEKRNEQEEEIEGEKGE
ncbi:hypothetical protein PMAYCL1PPCAC_15887, partial [Pristionchus mayeri]